jgi:hypothetical protein
MKKHYDPDTLLLVFFITVILLLDFRRHYEMIIALFADHTIPSCFVSLNSVVVSICFNCFLYGEPVTGSDFPSRGT